MADQFFQGLAFFDGLSREQLSLLRPLFASCAFDPGETIFEQGEPADYVYIVVRGEVVIEYKPYDGPALVIARIKPGGVFGWSAALSSQEYTSSAQSDAETTLLCVRGEDLRTLCHQQRAIGEIILNRLAAVIAERRVAHPQVRAMLENGLLNDTKREGG